MRLTSAPSGPPFVGALGDVLVCQGGDQWAPGPGGGGASFAFPGRVDCSVNNARVAELYSAAPVLHTQPSVNAAGAYNGGGVGNKSIIGYRVGNLLPLGSLVSLAWTWRDLNVATPSVPASCYANLILDVNGNGTAYKIGVVDPSSLAVLDQGTTIALPDATFTHTWLAASNNLLIVNGLDVPPLPPGGPGFVPPTVPGAPLPAGWTSNSYSVAAILAAYPACRLAEASSLDGGLPKAPNTTPAFLLIAGDSTNARIKAFRLTGVAFNGALV